MKRLLLFVMTISLAVSCKDDGKDAFTHDSVQRAAQNYYSMLIRGEYEQFVDGLATSGDSLPQGLRSQFVDMMRQYIHEQEAKGGLVRAVATADSLYEADSTALVFLDFVFADSTREQVCLPMVMKNEKWWMR